MRWMPPGALGGQPPEALVPHWASRGRSSAHGTVGTAPQGGRAAPRPQASTHPTLHQLLSGSLVGAAAGGAAGAQGQGGVAGSRWGPCPLHHSPSRPTCHPHVGAAAPSTPSPRHSGPRLPRDPAENPMAGKLDPGPPSSPEAPGMGPVSRTSGVSCLWACAGAGLGGREPAGRCPAPEQGTAPLSPLSLALPACHQARAAALAYSRASGRPPTTAKVREAVRVAPQGAGAQEEVAGTWALGPVSCLGSGQ